MFEMKKENENEGLDDRCVDDEEDKKRLKG
jgi:hypothetical protein